MSVLYMAKLQSSEKSHHGYKMATSTPESLEKWLLCYTGERQNALQSAGEASKKNSVRKRGQLEASHAKGRFFCRKYKRCTIAVGVYAAEGIEYRATTEWC